MTDAPHFDPADRRPLASRDRPVFKRIAAALARAGVSPNALSVLSIVFAAVGAAALVGTSRSEGLAARGLWLVAAAGAQLRLIMNLLDGMVAIEGGKGSPVGELYNEVPDRVSDPLLLVAAGFAAGGDAVLGFLAAIAAMFVAYVRAIGKGAGAGQVFIGPMAKQHRMFVLTAACVFCAVAPAAWQRPVGPLGWGPVAWALALIVAGCGVTAARRLRRIAATLRGAAP